MTDISRESLSKSIKGILKNGDLDQLSAKKIRKMLESEFKADLTERKEEIDKLVMTLITENESEDDDEEKSSVTEVKQKVATHATNGSSQPPKCSSSPKKTDISKNNQEGNHIKQEEDEHENSDDNDVDSELEEPEDAVPQKKAKLKPSVKNHKKSPKKMNDEELAKQLQEDENFRPSRRCKAQTVARKQKPRREGAKGTSVYSRPCALLPPLDHLLDTDRMPRPMIVKRLWEIVKERDLLDPKNKQFMLCDQQMLELFGKPRVRMFGVMKLLKPYIKDLPKE